MNIMQSLKNASKVGVPLVAIESPDQLETGMEVLAMVKELNAEFVAKNQSENQREVMMWNCLDGLVGLTRGAKEEIATKFDNNDETRKMQTMSLAETLLVCQKVKDNRIVLVVNAHRTMEDMGVSQGLVSLRNIFKTQGSMVILLGPMFTFPIELQRDIITLSEELPDDNKIKDIVQKVANDGGLKPLDEVTYEATIKACRGLSSFAVEQCTAMSIISKEEGISIKDVWARKRKMIEQTPGLTVLTGTDTFDVVGGIERMKQFGRELFNGNMVPSVIVFIDEGDKVFAGSGKQGGGDTSGVSQDILQSVLTSMEDYEWDGMILVGPPGCTKSLYAKTLSATFGVQGIKLDIGATKGSLVGQSEKQIREAMRIIKAISGKTAFFIMTCNDMDNLRPELRRRFKAGVWYCDLPDDAEKKSIWAINLKKYAIKKQPLPQDENWTGADIRNCCERAWRSKITLLEASKYLTPVHKSDPKSIQKLQELANGKFLSASYEGLYDITRNKKSEMDVKSRSILN